MKPTAILAICLAVHLATWSILAVVIARPTVAPPPAPICIVSAPPAPVGMPRFRLDRLTP
jgi:hypothetical protein